MRRVGETKARREIVGIVVEEVLPVVTETESHGEVRLQSDVIFNESAKNFFEEVKVPMTALDEIGRGMPGLVVGETGECVVPSLIREVVFAAAADIGNIDSEIESVLAFRVADYILSVEVIFGARCRPGRLRLRTIPRYRGFSFTLMMGRSKCPMRKRS